MIEANDREWRFSLSGRISQVSGFVRACFVCSRAYGREQDMTSVRDECGHEFITCDACDFTIPANTGAKDVEALADEFMERLYRLYRYDDHVKLVQRDAPDLYKPFSFTRSANA